MEKCCFFSILFLFLSFYVSAQSESPKYSWTFLTTEYGDLEITINLSKPEKDPKAIAAAKLVKSSSYPLCQLCLENEGYQGRINHPARANHRVIRYEMEEREKEKAGHKIV